MRPNSYCRFVQEDRLARRAWWSRSRAWWSRSSTTTTVRLVVGVSLTNFRNFSWSDQTREPRRNRLELQFTMGRTNSPSRCCCCTRRGQPKPTPIGSGYPPLSYQNRTDGSSWSENGAQRYSLPGGGIEKGGGPSGGVLVKGGVGIQKKELSGHNWRNRKDPPKAGTWRSEVQS